MSTLVGSQTATRPAQTRGGGILFRLNKVERIGMGIQKMKEAMVAAGLDEPAFATDSFFRATFHRSPEFAMKEGKEGSERSSEKSSEKIPAILKERNTTSAREIAEILGVTQRAVEKQIGSLEAASRLRRIGPAKGGRWEVVQ